MRFDPRSYTIMVSLYLISLSATHPRPCRFFLWIY